MALNPDPAGASAAPGTSSEPVPWRVGAGQLAAWGFSFLLLRVFAVSGYDWDTAFLVSTTLGLDDGFALVLGSLMAGETLTAVLLLVVLPLLVAAYLWGPREHRPVVLLLAVLGLVTMTALTASTGSWWLPLSCAASTRRPTSSWCWSCPVRAWSSARPSPKAWTRSFAMPVSNGANPAARCAWP